MTGSRGNFSGRAKLLRQWVRDVETKGHYIFVLKSSRNTEFLTQVSGGIFSGILKQMGHCFTDTRRCSRRLKGRYKRESHLHWTAWPHTFTQIAHTEFDVQEMDTHTQSAVPKHLLSMQPNSWWITGGPLISFLKVGELKAEWQFIFSQVLTNGPDEFSYPNGQQLRAVLCVISFQCKGLTLQCTLAGLPHLTLPCLDSKQSPKQGLRKLVPEHL